MRAAQIVTFMEAAIPEGAVYFPEESIVPVPVPSTLQVTLVVFRPSSLAVKVVVLVATTLALPGSTVSVDSARPCEQILLEPHP